MGIYESAMIILPIAITVLIFLTGVLSITFYFAKEEQEKMELAQFIGQRSQNRKKSNKKTKLISIYQYQRSAEFKKSMSHKVSA